VHAGESEAQDIMKNVGHKNKTSMNFEEFVAAVGSATSNDHVTQDQELQACFRAFDKNGDGRISLEELELAMKELGENMTMEELHEMMKDGDVDKDGMIDFEEFKRLLPAA
jgi:calmodulin